MDMIGVDQIYDASGNADMPIVSNAVVYTKSFKLDYGTKFGVQYKASVTGGADISVKIELEEGNVMPAVEGAADANFAIPVGGLVVVADVTDALVHITSLAPVVAKYGRFKITGSGTNTATVKMNMKLSKTEEHG